MLSHKSNCAIAPLHEAHRRVGTRRRKEGGYPELVHPDIGNQDVVVLQYRAQVGQHALRFEGK